VKYVDFTRGDTLPDYFLDALNEYVSTGVFNLQIMLANPTTLMIPAGTINDQVGAAVEAQWRYIRATVYAAHPGGPPGWYDIWITAEENDFSGIPPNQDQTDYTFALIIKPLSYVWTGSDPPLQRKLGQCYWNGSAITLIDSPYARYAPDSVPIGGMMDWPWAADDIPDKYMLPYGQAISRALYPDLHSIAQSAGYPYGNGDGTTTFNLPDFRGRIAIGKDDMGGTAAGRITIAGSGMDGTIIGNAGGDEDTVLTISQIPSHSHPLADPGHIHPIADPGHAHTEEGVQQHPSASGGSPTTGGRGAHGQLQDTSFNYTGLQISSATTGVSITPTGGGQGHSNIPPAIIVNKLIRVG
jgi:microcystin-dependent protein